MAPLLILAVSWITPTTLPAAMVVLNAASDTSLFSESGSVSNGAGEFLFAGNTNSGASRRALIRFDTSGIPAGSVITSVSLTLFMSKTAAGAEMVDVHRLTNAFGEGTSNAGGQEGAGTTATAGDSTWTDNFFGVTTWTTAGGDFVPTASAAQSVAGVAGYTWSGAGMEADVQAWVDGSALNLGWIMLGNEGANLTAKRFNSRTNAANTPQLVVEYVPEPSVAVLFSLVGFVALRRRR